MATKDRTKQVCVTLAPFRYEYGSLVEAWKEAREYARQNRHDMAVIYHPLFTLIVRHDGWTRWR